MLRFGLYIPVIIGIFLMQAVTSSVQESERHDELEFMKKHIKLIYSRIKSIDESNKAVVAEVRNMQDLLVKSVINKTGTSSAAVNYDMNYDAKKTTSEQTATELPLAELDNTIFSNSKDHEGLKGNVRTHEQSSEIRTLMKSASDKAQDDCKARKKGNRFLVVASLASFSVAKFDEKVKSRKYYLPAHIIKGVYDGMCSLYFSTFSGIIRIVIPHYNTHDLVVKEKVQHLGIDTSLQRLFTLSRNCRLKYVDLHTMALQEMKGKLSVKCNIRGIDLMVNAKSRQIFVNNYYRSELMTMDYEGNVLTTQKLNIRISSMVFAPEYNEIFGYSQHSLVSLSINDTSNPRPLLKRNTRLWPATAYFKGTFAVGVPHHEKVYRYDGGRMRMETKVKIGFARALTFIEE